jgi:hypothetical protein
VKPVEVTRLQTQGQTVSSPTTPTLEYISNELAAKLSDELEKYVTLMDQKETLELQIHKTLVQVKRAKQALEALQGTTFDIPELESASAEPPRSIVAESPGMVKVERAAVPLPPPPIIRDTSNDCPGCGSEGSLYNTVITTSRGRRVNVLQCGHSGCNAQYPT